MMRVKYTNGNDSEISESQTLSLRIFNKLYIKDNKTKIKETFQNGELIRLTYFYQEGENENDLIAKYSFTPKFWMILVTRSSFGDYVIEECNVYKENELLEKYRRLSIVSEDFYLLAKSNYSNICHQPIDLGSGMPIISQTTKFYYFIDEEEEGFVPYFKATYNESGGIALITHFDVYDLDDHKGGRTLYGAEDAAKFRFLLPENPDYFLDATFEPF